MVRCNDVTIIAAAVGLCTALAACGGSLSPADERAPASKADPLTASSVAVAPAPPVTSSCDEKVAAAKASGALAPVATDPTVDPLCQWRIDDARNAVTVGAASATLSTPAGNASPGILSTTGGTPPEIVGEAFRNHAGDIAACGRAAANAPPILRVRVVSDANGTVTWAGADYRANLPQTARACVETALRGKPFLSRSAGSVTATYGYAFGTAR